MHYLSQIENVHVCIDNNHERHKISQLAPPYGIGHMTGHAGIRPLNGHHHQMAGTIGGHGNFDHRKRLKRPNRFIPPRKGHNDIRFINRRSHVGNRKDGIVAVGYTGNFIYGPRCARGGSKSRILSKRAFLHPHMGQHMAFDNNLCASRNLQVNGFALYQLNRRFSQTTAQIRLTFAGPGGKAPPDNREGITPDHRGERHRLIGLFILLIHAADILTGKNKPSHHVFRMDHLPVHSPVNPTGVFQVTRHDEVPSADVPPAVTIVRHGSTKLEQINIVPLKDIFLTRTVTDQHGFNGIFDPFVELFCEFLHRRIRLHPQRNSHP